MVLFFLPSLAYLYLAVPSPEHPDAETPNLSAEAACSKRCMPLCISSLLEQRAGLGSCAFGHQELAALLLLLYAFSALLVDLSAFQFLD
jgi:hypothetical protein